MLTFEIEITYKLIEDGRSSNGGWSRYQLALLGVSWPPPLGWQKEVVGRSMSEEDAILFVDLKNKHLGTNKKFKNRSSHKARSRRFAPSFTGPENLPPSDLPEGESPF